MRGRLVAVEGPSASGKSRAVRGASRRLGATVLPEAYDRIRPALALTWTSAAGLRRLERRLLRDDGRRYREGRERSTGGATVLADTGFLGPLTYTAGLVRLGLAPRPVLVDLLQRARASEAEGQWGLPDAIVYLRTPLAERRRRAEGDPQRHPAHLRRRHEAVATEESRFYRTVVAPEYRDRFVFVSGRGSPDDVVARLVKAVERTPVRIRPPVARRILEAIDRVGSVP
jgi:thymidylate kinase